MSATGLLGPLDAAAEAVRRNAKAAPVIGLVLGSVLGVFMRRFAVLVIAASTH